MKTLTRKDIQALGEAALMLERYEATLISGVTPDNWAKQARAAARAARKLRQMAKPHDADPARKAVGTRRYGNPLT